MASDIKEDGSEIIHYDDSDFPIFCRHNYIPAGFPLRNYTPHHWHDEVEMIFVEKGRIHHTINDVYITLQAGEGLFINSRQLHELITDDKEDCTLYCLIFNPRILSNCVKMEERVNRIVNNENLGFTILDENCDWQRSIIENMKQAVELSEQEGTSGEIIARVFCLWDAVYNNLSSKTQDDNYINYGQRLVKDMINYIQHNYREDISLEDICHAVNAGKTKCSVTFKRYVHMSPVNFLRRYRLEKSFDLLIETDMSIAEIAYEVGFTSASYYGEFFKKTVGMTPLKMRQKSQEEKAERT